MFEVRRAHWSPSAASSAIMARRRWVFTELIDTPNVEAIRSIEYSSK